MSDDDDFFAACERYQGNRILQGGPQIDQEPSGPYSTSCATLPSGESRISETLLPPKKDVDLPRQCHCGLSSRPAR
jgi:hypothetical protein